MIQRVQSIYLLIVSLFYFLYWFFGFEYYEKGFFIIDKSLGNLSNLIFSITSTFPFLIFIICLFTIFLFKKRKIQIVLCRFSLLISIIVSLYTIIYFSFSLNYLLESMSSIIMQVLLYAAILNPFICTFFIYLSIESIINDEKLVRGDGMIR